jgi:glucose/mannose transport system substrate-binding protein
MCGRCSAVGEVRPRQRGRTHITIRQHLQVALLIGLAWCSAAACAQTLDVMHWWTSASERQAANQLAAALSAQGVVWQDAAVPGGGGVAAVKVLKSRVIAGDPPAAAQVIGKTLTDWADLGLVLPLDGVAQRGRWRQVMFPAVLQVVTHRDHLIAAPLGIHRINSLLYQRRLFDRLGLAPPQTWRDLEAAATRLRSLGIRPLAWSDEAWQVATVFEALLLSEVGPALYRELVQARRPQAWLDSGVERALERLRWLRGLNGNESRQELGWVDGVRQLQAQRAGMLLNGDWARGELMALGEVAGEGYDCVVVPGTAGMHLYSIDTLAMLVGRQAREAAQEKAAEVFTGLPAQRAYNRVKGAVPVRSDIDPGQLDACARDSWATFADRSAERVPSLAHRMAADESTKDAIAEVVQRFVLNPAARPLDTQRRLVAVVRAMQGER